MASRQVGAAILLVFATMLAAGCGGSRPSSKVRTTQRAAAAGFASRVESACLRRNDELRQLSQPRNQADFTGYIASMLNVVRFYRGQLAALHPTVGRQHFARYGRLLRADEASAVALLKAVRRGDRRAATRLVAQQRDRSTLEQTLLKGLGVSC
jgi:hypothetical protein